jgi:flagellar hook-associated protein 3 FlgL
MTAFRVTERSIATNILVGLQGNLGKLGDIQQRLSTGKQISKPSDSPTGTVAAMQYRGDLATAKQYARNADDGLGWLGLTDGTLGNIMGEVQRTRELALQGMSNGSGGSADAREAIATEIDQIHDATIGLANTRYGDRPIFGGTTTGQAAYDVSGTYLGDPGVVQRTVGDNVKVPVGTPGPSVFGAGTGQLFQIMSDIATDLRTNPSALSADLDRLDAVTTTLKAVQSAVGARYNQVTQMQQFAYDKVDSLSSQLSDVEDIDLPKTISDMQLQQVAYQAALAAGAKVVQPSLVDFLR